MSQRYPDYFDGIISGDPAIRTGHSNLALGFMTAMFDQAAPKDDSGKPDPKKTFSPSDRKLIVGSLLQACDAKDGVKDGMIFNQRACDFDPAALVCSGTKTDTCLSRTQVDTLKTAFAGPKWSYGDQIYPGVPFDAGIDDTGFHSRPVERTRDSGGHGRRFHALRCGSRSRASGSRQDRAARR